MSSTGARPRRGWTRQGWTRQGWTLSDDEAQTLLANARRAFFVMVGILASAVAKQRPAGTRNRPTRVSISSVFAQTAYHFRIGAPVE